MPLTRDKKTGRFKRTLIDWRPDIWDEGFLNNKGRFLVYKPISGNVLYQGYALRSYVVWEWYSGKVIPKGYVIHHINGDKTDDRYGNLQLLTKKKHDKLHSKNRIKWIERQCKYCKKMFNIKPSRLNAKDWKRGTFCSQKCYHKAGGRWYKS